MRDDANVVSRPMHPVVDLWRQVEAEGGVYGNTTTNVAKLIGEMAWEQIGVSDPFLVMAHAASALDAAGLADGCVVLQSAAEFYNLCEYRSTGASR